MKFTKNLCFSTIYVVNGVNPRKITWWYVTIALHLASIEDKHLVVTLLTVS